MNAVKGQFIPDLLLLASAFVSPAEMQETFAFLDDLFASGGQPASRLRKDSITAFTVWVHEFTHFLQFTTRISGVDYYAFSSSLANYSIETAKKLKDRLSSDISAFLPIHKHITHTYDRFADVDELSKDWLEYYVNANLVLATGGWSPRPEHDSLLLERVAATATQDILPRLTCFSEDGETSERHLSTENVLEAEAFIVSTNVLRAYFPSEYEEVLPDLHPTVDEHIDFALKLISQGYGLLVPIMADFSMQAASFLPDHDCDTEDAFRRVSVPWRFLKAMEMCEPYRGIGFAEYGKHVSEIQRKLESTWPSQKGNSQIKNVLARLENGDVAGISESLSLLLQHNIRIRVDEPGWFASPETFLSELHSRLHLPRVKFAHRGVDKGDAYLSSMGFGDKSMSPAEQAELLFDCNRRWLGRQLAKTCGAYVCPDCLLDYRQPECNNGCFYSKCVAEILGFCPENHWIAD